MSFYMFNFFLFWKPNILSYSCYSFIFLDKESQQEISFQFFLSLYHNFSFAHIPHSMYALSRSFSFTHFLSPPIFYLFLSIPLSASSYFISPTHADVNTSTILFLLLLVVKQLVVYFTKRYRLIFYL